MPPAQHTAAPPSRAPDSGALPLLLAMLVFLVTLLVTFFAWRGASQSADARLAQSFEYRSRDMVYNISRRMAVYEQVLRGARGYLRGSVTLERGDWAEYYRVLRLDQAFPGMEALGIASMLEAKPGAMRTAITHIEPATLRNGRAFGFDMYGEPVRRAAMERARDSGGAALSGKVVLVQEGAGGAPQSGALMYLPVYRAGLPTASVEQRRAALAGWVYAPFRMNDLMRGLGGAHSTDLDIEIHDGAPQGDATLLYRSDPADGAQRNARLATRAQILPGGRTWTVAMRSSAAFEDSLDTTRPLLVALTGIGLGVLLGVVVWLLASSRRRALLLARAMTLELRQSHDQVAAERQRIQVILEHTHDAFLAVDASSRITDWNVQAARLFGWSAEEAIGRNVEDLLPPNARAAFRAGFTRLNHGDACPLLGGPTELDVIDRAGRRIPVELSGAVLPTGAGFGATIFVRDISARREALQREQQRQLRLDEARQALARGQKLEAVGKLTGGVAHDFNNILHIISANVQLMLRGDRIGDDVRKRLLNILDAVERGAKLAGQLLAFARRQPLHPSEVHVDALLARMDSLVARAAGDGVIVERSSPAAPWATLVDPNQLENVLLNLVINARDAMDGSGRVQLRLANLTVEQDPELAPGDYVTVAVSDSGQGMPPEVMERVFEPFFTTKPEGKGTGLGLSMAHGFARQSGGDIRIESVPGEGTTVTLYLPRHVAMVQQPAPA